MEKTTAIVHAAPAMGAAFTQYTAEFEAGGVLGPAAGQRFAYVLEGELTAGDAGAEVRLSPGGYLYAPAAAAVRVVATTAARAAVIEKPYRPLAGRPAPRFFAGDERTLAPRLFMDDPWLEVRTLIPDDPAFDFAVNTMTFQPGASLPMVEIHVMEHGLVMLAGGGVYRLGDHWYPVRAGDFIWMAPYCPQWFGALGKIPSKYLIYKDWNRRPEQAK